MADCWDCDWRHSNRPCGSFMYFFMSLGRILFQGSVSTNLLNSMRHEVDLWNVAVCIQIVGNIHLVAEVILPGYHYTPHVGRNPRFSMCFLVYLSLLHNFLSQGIGFSLWIFASSPELENIFEGVKKAQHVLHVAQCCNLVRCILSVKIEW